MSKPSARRAAPADPGTYPRRRGKARLVVGICLAVVSLVAGGVAGVWDVPAAGLLRIGAGCGAGLALVLIVVGATRLRSRPVPVVTKDPAVVEPAAAAVAPDPVSPSLPPAILTDIPDPLSECPPVVPSDQAQGYGWMKASDLVRKGK